MPKVLVFAGNGSGVHQRAGSADDALAIINSNRSGEEQAERSLTLSTTADRLAALRLNVSSFHIYKNVK